MGSCKSCNKNLDITIQISEKVLINALDEVFEPIILNNEYSTAIKTYVQKGGYKTKIHYYTIMVKNFKKFNEFLKKEITGLTIDDVNYKNYKIEYIKDNVFKITIEQ